MNYHRIKEFPKTRHFGLKRAVYIEEPKPDSENDEDKNKEDNDDQENKEESKNENKEDKEKLQNEKDDKKEALNKMNLLSFSISTDILPMLERAPSNPGFDWIHESESKERIFYESNFEFNENEINSPIRDNYDPNQT